MKHSVSLVMSGSQNSNKQCGDQEYGKANPESIYSPFSNVRVVRDRAGTRYCRRFLPAVERWQRLKGDRCCSHGGSGAEESFTWRGNYNDKEKRDSR